MVPLPAALRHGASGVSLEQESEEEMSTPISSQSYVVTLPYNQKDKVACEKLAGLLSVRLFVELDKHKDFDIDSRSQAIGSKIAIGIKFLMAIIHKKRL
jgi:hypothetical protein